jgi:uncharacterized membrane protein YoaK (UPF0700 family)
MLSAHAYSFRQKSRLAISLSWIGGYTNVITLIATTQVVSHNTGNTTSLGRMIASPMDGEPFHTAFTYALIIAAFVFGAVLSAIMTEKADRRGISSRYIAPMATEGMLLGVYAIFINVWARSHGYVSAGHPVALAQIPPVWIVTLAAVAMGLQNATITKISGAVVRTTHVTGVLTDIGLEGVQLFLWWREKTKSRKLARYGRVLRVSRRHPEFLRVLLLASIFGSFLFGATAGTVLYYHFPGQAMLAPILFLGWIVLIDWYKPIAVVTQLDPMSDPEMALYGIVKSLLPSELGIYRLAHPRANAFHHAPNFQSWVNRLPSHWRVVILAVTPLTQFDGESVADLRIAAQRLKGSRRRLVVSGVNTIQFRLMNDKGLFDILENSDVAPDLEFAIARGIDLLEELSEDSTFRDARHP